MVCNSQKWLLIGHVLRWVLVMLNYWWCFISLRSGFRRIKSWWFVIMSGWQWNGDSCGPIEISFNHPHIQIMVYTMKMMRGDRISGFFGYASAGPSSAIFGLPLVCAASTTINHCQPSPTIMFCGYWPLWLHVVTNHCNGLVLIIVRW